jgi:hypothetical protein
MGTEPGREVVQESPPLETLWFPEPSTYPDLNDGLVPFDDKKTGSGDIMAGPDAPKPDSEYPDGYESEPGWY